MGIIKRLNAKTVLETALLFKADCACRFWLVFDATGTLTSFTGVAVPSTVDGVTYIGATVKGVHFTLGSFGFCPGAHIGGGWDDGNGANGVSDGNGANGASGNWS